MKFPTHQRREMKNKEKQLIINCESIRPFRPLKPTISSLKHISTHKSMYDVQYMAQMIASQDVMPCQSHGFNLYFIKLTIGTAVRKHGESPCTIIGAIVIFTIELRIRN